MNFKFPALTLTASIFIAGVSMAQTQQTIDLNPSAPAATVSQASAVLVSGAIGFAGNTTAFNLTTILAGSIPSGSVNAGTYGQISASQTAAQNIGANGQESEIAKDGWIRYAQKAAGVNGQFTLQATPTDSAQLKFAGTIQLSNSLTKQIQDVYGKDAKVTSMGMWVVQDLSYVAAYSPQKYSGQIIHVMTFLYINSQTTPVGPIIF